MAGRGGGALTLTRTHGPATLFFPTEERISEVKRASEPPRRVTRSPSDLFSNVPTILVMNGQPFLTLRPLGREHIHRPVKVTLKFRSLVPQT